jgi:outer membrane protein OmpA-like peptidoglycan-associated protein
MRAKLAIGLAILLTGCTTYSLEELRKTTPSGSEFNQTLTRLYLDYAEQQAKNYDWYDSMIFADKGLLTAYDHEVGPEDLNNWDIPLEILPVMEKVRADLLAAMTPQNMVERPAIVAEAQFYFDCWVENQDDNSWPEEIAYCRDHLRDRLAELSDTSYLDSDHPVASASSDAMALAAPRKSVESAVDSVTYIVFFDWGQYQLNETGAFVVDTVIDTLYDQTRYDIVLNAHTDRSGADQYNQMLSMKRAESVKARLVAGGIKAEVIKIYAFGESDTPTKTKDGAREKANRRVEIVLSE